MILNVNIYISLFKKKMHPVNSGKTIGRLALPVPTRQHNKQLAGGENVRDVKVKLSTNRTGETDRHSLSAAT
jgi:hypothetical protein